MQNVISFISNSATLGDFKIVIPNMLCKSNWHSVKVVGIEVNPGFLGAVVIRIQLPILVSHNGTYAILFH